MHAPAIQIIPLADDVALEEVTRAIAASPPDIAVATTGIGFRGWMEAADGWNLTDEVLAEHSARVACSPAGRRPRAPSAPRACPRSGRRRGVVSEGVDHLLAEGVEGKRIAVQLQVRPPSGNRSRISARCCAAADAEVIPVPVPRWIPPAGPRSDGPRILEAIVSRLQVDFALRSPSAPPIAVDVDARPGTSTCWRRRCCGRSRGRVLAACVDADCHHRAPFGGTRRPSVPGRTARAFGPLAGHGEEEQQHRSRRIYAGGHELGVRGGWSCRV